MSFENYTITAEIPKTSDNPCTGVIYNRFVLNSPVKVTYPINHKTPSLKDIEYTIVENFGSETWAQVLQTKTIDLLERAIGRLQIFKIVNDLSLAGDYTRLFERIRIGKQIHPLTVTPCLAHELEHLLDPVFEIETLEGHINAEVLAYTTTFEVMDQMSTIFPYNQLTKAYISYKRVGHKAIYDYAEWVTLLQRQIDLDKIVTKDYVFDNINQC